jgi:hypothetical protein
VREKRRKRGEREREEEKDGTGILRAKPIRLSDHFLSSILLLSLRIQRVPCHIAGPPIVISAFW